MAETVAVRVSFPSGDLSLEGALHVAGATPAPAVVVCHPHPQYGGDMDNNVVLAACSALASAGITALRFNFRGVADSDGAFDQGQGEQDDVRAALAHLGSLSEVDGGALGLKIRRHFLDVGEPGVEIALAYVEFVLELIRVRSVLPQAASLGGEFLGVPVELLPRRLQRAECLGAKGLRFRFVR